MSKTLKTMIMRDYKARMSKPAEGGGEAGVTEAALLLGMRGLNAIDTTKLRTTLAKKHIRVTVVRNALARNLIKGTSLEPLGELMVGSSALAYSTAKDVTVVEVARELVEAAKAAPKLELKGAVLDGTVFAGKQAVEDLSRYPTRTEAIANLVGALLGPGKKLAASVKGPGGTLGALISAIEGKLEKGEAIAKQ